MRFKAFPILAAFSVFFAASATAFAQTPPASPAPSAETSPPANATAGTTATTSAEPTAAPAPPPPAIDAPQDGAARKPDEDKLRRAYLSFSPVHLILPMAEVMAEFRVHPKIGVAAIGGYGKVTVRSLAVSRGPSSPLLSTQETSVSVYEVGGQFVGYPLGTFDHGMQVGAEVLYLGASTSAQQGDVKVVASGAGLSTGGFVGYKLATRVGFTFNVQGGVGYLAVQASGGGASASDSRIYPLLNANVGWSL